MSLHKCYVIILHYMLYIIMQFIIIQYVTYPIILYEYILISIFMKLYFILMEMIQYDITLLLEDIKSKS